MNQKLKIDEDFTLNVLEEKEDVKVFLDGNCIIKTEVQIVNTNPEIDYTTLPLDQIKEEHDQVNTEHEASNLLSPVIDIKEEESDDFVEDLECNDFLPLSSENLFNCVDKIEIEEHDLLCYDVKTEIDLEETNVLTDEIFPKKKNNDGLNSVKQNCLSTNLKETNQEISVISTIKNSLQSNYARQNNDSQIELSHIKPNNQTKLEIEKPLPCSQSKPLSQKQNPHNKMICTDFNSNLRPIKIIENCVINKGESLTSNRNFNFQNTSKLAVDKTPHKASNGRKELNVDKTVINSLCNKIIKNTVKVPRQQNAPPPSPLNVNQNTSTVAKKTKVQCRKTVDYFVTSEPDVKKRRLSAGERVTQVPNKVPEKLKDHPGSTSLLNNHIRVKQKSVSNEVHVRKNEKTPTPDKIGVGKCSVTENLETTKSSKEYRGEYKNGSLQTEYSNNPCNQEEKKRKLSTTVSHSVMNSTKNNLTTSASQKFVSPETKLTVKPHTNQGSKRPPSGVKSVESLNVLTHRTKKELQTPSSTSSASSDYTSSESLVPSLSKQNRGSWKIANCLMERDVSLSLVKKPTQEKTVSSSNGNSTPQNKVSCSLNSKNGKGSLDSNILKSPNKENIGNVLRCLLEQDDSEQQEEIGKVLKRLLEEDEENEKRVAREKMDSKLTPLQSKMRHKQNLKSVANRNGTNREGSLISPGLNPESRNLEVEEILTFQKKDDSVVTVPSLPSSFQRLYSHSEIKSKLRPQPNSISNQNVIAKRIEIATKALKSPDHTVTTLKFEAQNNNESQTVTKSTNIANLSNSNHMKPTFNASTLNDLHLNREYTKHLKLPLSASKTTNSIHCSSTPTVSSHSETTAKTETSTQHREISSSNMTKAVDQNIGRNFQQYSNKVEIPEKKRSTPDIIKTYAARLAECPVHDSDQAIKGKPKQISPIDYSTKNGKSSSVPQKGQTSSFYIRAESRSKEDQSNDNVNKLEVPKKNCSLPTPLTPEVCPKTHIIEDSSSSSSLESRVHGRVRLVISNVHRRANRLQKKVDGRKVFRAKLNNAKPASGMSVPNKKGDQSLRPLLKTSVDEISAQTGKASKEENHPLRQRNGNVPQLNSAPNANRATNYLETKLNTAETQSPLKNNLNIGSMGLIQTKSKNVAGLKDLEVSKTSVRSEPTPATSFPTSKVSVTSEPMCSVSVSRKTHLKMVDKEILLQSTRLDLTNRETPTHAAYTDSKQLSQSVSNAFPTKGSVDRTSLGGRPDTCPVKNNLRINQVTAKPALNDRLTNTHDRKNLEVPKFRPMVPGKVNNIVASEPSTSVSTLKKTSPNNRILTPNVRLDQLKGQIAQKTNADSKKPISNSFLTKESVGRTSLTNGGSPDTSVKNNLNINQATVKPAINDRLKNADHRKNLEVSKIRAMIPGKVNNTVASEPAATVSNVKKTSPKIMHLGRDKGIQIPDVPLDRLEGQVAAQMTNADTKRPSQFVSNSSLTKGSEGRSSLPNEGRPDTSAKNNFRLNNADDRKNLEVSKIRAMIPGKTNNVASEPAATVSYIKKTSPKIVTKASADRNSIPNRERPRFSEPGPKRSAERNSVPNGRRPQTSSTENNLNIKSVPVLNQATSKSGLNTKLTNSDDGNISKEISIKLEASTDTNLSCQPTRKRRLDLRNFPVHQNHKQATSTDSSGRVTADKNGIKRENPDSSNSTASTLLDNAVTRGCTFGRNLANKKASDDDYMRQNEGPPSKKNKLETTNTENGDQDVLYYSLLKSEIPRKVLNDLETIETLENNFIDNVVPCIEQFASHNIPELASSFLQKIPSYSPIARTNRWVNRHFHDRQNRQKHASGNKICSKHNVLAAKPVGSAEALKSVNKRRIQHCVVMNKSGDKNKERTGPKKKNIFVPKVQALQKNNHASTQRKQVGGQPASKIPNLVEPNRGNFHNRSADTDKHKLLLKQASERCQHNTVEPKKENLSITSTETSKKENVSAGSTEPPEKNILVRSPKERSPPENALNIKVKSKRRNSSTQNIPFRLPAPTGKNVLVRSPKETPPRENASSMKVDKRNPTTLEKNQILNGKEPIGDNKLKTPPVVEMTQERIDETYNTVNDFMRGMLNPGMNASTLPTFLGQLFAHNYVLNMLERFSQRDKE